MTPCLKKFCASAPAEDHARVRRTRAHARKNFAPGWAGAWAGAAARFWFARVLKLSACCPGPVICWAVCGHGGRPGHGGACPLACAAAWAVRPAPGPACVHVCMGALVCRPAAWAMPAASGHSHTPGGPHPARRPAPCRRSAACLLPCPRPPACSPAGRRSCRPGPLRRWRMSAGGVLCARSGVLVV